MKNFNKGLTCTCIIISFSIVSCGQDIKNIEIKDNDKGAGYSIYPPSWPNKGLMFVDHQANGRSGHGGQSITECINGDILAFYSNVDGDFDNGHNVAGWSEYKISSDGGETWSEPYVFEYSKKVWDQRENNEIISMLVWEVVTAPNGNVIATGRSSDAPKKWGGDAPPVYFLSYDNGKTWSEPKLFSTSESAGISREEASMVHNGEIFILFHDYYATDRKFRLYVSSDNGESFHERSELPFATKQWYGTMTVLPDGKIIVYTYNTSDDGTKLQYITSSDNGLTWSNVYETSLAKRIRKPRISQRVGDYYFLHGRSGHEGDNPRNLVLYSSKDGIIWDQGVFLNKGGRDVDSYSANEIIGKYDPDRPERLLIQSSVSYEETGGRVNLHHWFIELNTNDK